MSWLLCFRVGDGMVPSERAVTVGSNACKPEWEDWLIVPQFSSIEALAHPIRSTL